MAVLNVRIFIFSSSLSPLLMMYSWPELWLCFRVGEICCPEVCSSFTAVKICTSKYNTSRSDTCLMGWITILVSPATWLRMSRQQRHFLLWQLMERCLSIVTVLRLTGRGQHCTLFYCRVINVSIELPRDAVTSYYMSISILSNII